ncbi:MAG: HigA family addiction module antitoxin [Gammaproteobacteria bacterium]|nr:HigA family addiction module antitoxin [Gammaproteobacteria bacterium]
MEKEAIHPGEFLADELIEIKISPTELSRQIDVPANRISQIIRGKRDITADTALRLGKFFGTGPELWMNLQKAYELDKARAALGSKIRRIHRWQPEVHTA